MSAPIFCTYFNLAYLPKALALIESLKQVRPNFKLVALTLDSSTFDYLKQCDLENIVLVQISEIENAYPELLRIKRTRSLVEYYWTQTPFLCRYVQEKYKHDVVYLDADMIFYEDPQPLIDEMKDYSVGICAHRYPSYYDKSSTSGRFNVAWNYFKNDLNAATVLSSWSEDCFTSCAVDKNTCGDQKYLNSWTSKFTNIHIVRHRGADCAPWNFYSHKIDQVDKQLFVEGEPLIFFHFHGLKQYKHHFFWPNISYPITYYQLVLYLDYIKRLKKHTAIIQKNLSKLNSNFSNFNLLEQIIPFATSLRILYWQFTSYKQNAIV